MPRIAKRPEDLLGLDELKKLSGLEFIQGMTPC